MGGFLYLMVNKLWGDFCMGVASCVCGNFQASCCKVCSWCLYTVWLHVMQESSIWATLTTVCRWLCELFAVLCESTEGSIDTAWMREDVHCIISPLPALPSLQSPLSYRFS